MASTATRFVVCYALGTGAGFDPQLGGLSRQICEDLAECLTLYDGFITVPQMVVVRGDSELSYRVDKNACAFAVFYSLPETKWVLDSTRAIGGDIALTGRIVDDESGLMLSINLVEVSTRNLLFCGCETCPRSEIQLAVARMGARILSHCSDVGYADWLGRVTDILGTRDHHAYMNWLQVREIERRAQREGVNAPSARIVEHLSHALDADPHFEKASLRLCEILGGQLERPSYDFILRYVRPIALETEALSLIAVQCLARVGRRGEAETLLGEVIGKHPENGLFWLMRGCLGSDARQASRDLDEARHLLGNDFHGCRSAVDNALLNVTGV